MTPDALRETFGAAGQSARIVVLSGCSSEALMKALCELVPVCVGTSAAAGHDAARAFSIGFYGALASSESASRACRYGKAAMHLKATGDLDAPHLHHRHDVDPDMLVLGYGEQPPTGSGPSSAVFPSTEGSGTAGLRYEVTLEVSMPDGAKSRLTVESSTVRIGAYRSNDIVIPHERVSSEHGVFQCRNADMTYEDLSRNGSTIIRKGGDVPQQLRRQSARLDLLDRVELGGSGISIRVTRISRGR